MEKTNLPQDIIDEEAILTLKEFCSICGVAQEYVIEMVEMGILEPDGRTISSWQFSVIQMLRFKKAQRLQTDLKINLAGVALGLELLDEINQLREDLKKLQQELESFTHIL